MGVVVNAGGRKFKCVETYHPSIYELGETDIYIYR